MKTIKEWLEELPEPIKSRALQRLDQNKSQINVDSMCDALGIGFIWFYTEEGYNYWSDVAHGKYDLRGECQLISKDQLLSKLNTFNPKRHTTKQVIEELTAWAKELK